MPRADRTSSEGGFTLIEVIVVLVILGLLGGLVLARGPQRSATLELRSAVSTAAGALRLGRVRAIAENRPVAVQLDGSGVTVSGSARRAFPAGVTLLVTGPPGAAAGRIVFLPDGSATGGTVLIRIAGLSAQLGVDWLGGTVTVGGAQRDAS